MTDLDLSQATHQALQDEIAKRGGFNLSKFKARDLANELESRGYLVSDMDALDEFCPPALHRLLERMALGEDITEPLAKLAYDLWSINALPIKPRKSA